MRTKYRLDIQPVPPGSWIWVCPPFTDHSARCSRDAKKPSVTSVSSVRALSRPVARKENTACDPPISWHDFHPFVTAGIA